MLLPLLSCYCAASATVMPLLRRLLGFLSPPYCYWLNPHFDTALFISDATVATLYVSLHSSPQPMLCYLRSVT
jgi:hypothetical protein